LIKTFTSNASSAQARHEMQESLEEGNGADAVSSFEANR